MIDAKYKNLPEPQIALSKIALDPLNPRIERESSIIEALLEHEDIYAIARSIVNLGMNQMDRPGVIKSDTANSDYDYLVLEGNRRICALYLLRSPNKAPAEYRDDFKKLKAKINGPFPFSKLKCVLYPNRAAAEPFIDMMHMDGNSGASRKRWEKELKLRRENPNHPLLQVLDYAVQEGMLQQGSLRGYFTNYERILRSPRFRQSLGISFEGNSVLIYRSKDEFNLLLKHFIVDLKDDVVNSRKCGTVTQIHKYGLDLLEKFNLGEPLLAPKPFASLNETTEYLNDVTDDVTDEDNTQDTDSEVSKTTKSGRPKGSRNKQGKLHISRDLIKALEAIPGKKYSSLCKSITFLKLEDHTPLLTIGLWSLLESLSRAMGRTPAGSEFVGFYNQKIAQWKEKKHPLSPKWRNMETSAISNYLKQLQEVGNFTKHDPIGANFDKDQLENAVASLNVFLIECAKIVEKDFK